MQGPKKSLMWTRGAARDRTKRDPALTKSDALAGQVAGHSGVLPPVWDRLRFQVTLMERVVGATSELSIEPLKHHEPLMLSVGTAVTVGVVTSAKKDLAEVTLKRPVCAEPGARIAISRQWVPDGVLSGWVS